MGVILLQKSGMSGGQMDDQATIKCENSDDTDKHVPQKMKPRVTEETKCPSISSLDLSEMDDFFGIEGGDASGSTFAAVDQGSEKPFDLGFTGEVQRELERTSEEGLALANSNAGNFEIRADNMEPIPFVRERGRQETEPSDKRNAVNQHDVLGSDEQLDAAALVPSQQRLVTNEAVLRKVQEACILVEAASELDGSAFAEDGKHRDLLVVGKHLYEHFSGQCSSGVGPSGATASTSCPVVVTSGDHRIKRGKTAEARNVIPLSAFGYPVALSNMVDLLYRFVEADEIDSSDHEGMQYSSIEDVLNDLKLMSRDPDRFLFGSEFHQTGTLNLVYGKLYGREKESERLEKTFQSLQSSGSRSIVCITGDSGTGKSALAVQLRNPVQSSGGFFLDAKFDELQQVKQVPVVFSALDALCSEVVCRGGPMLVTTRGRLQSALGSEMQVLLSTIPSLGTVIGVTDGDTPDLTGHAAFMRLLFCVRQLIKSIACQERPVVLMIDDLQWADDFSLALLEAILTDAEITSFLLIMCYRDGEVPEDHSLQKTLSAIQHSGVVVNKVHLDNIDRSSVTTLTSDALQVMPSQARPLANLIHSKTSGQPLFIVQFLKSLYEDRLLRFSVSSRQWEWDAGKISDKSVADTVADVMTGKMLRYSEEVLISLKLAACLGHEFDTKILDLLGTQDADGPSMTDNLNVALVDGLLIKSQTSTSTVYRFSHDQIQFAAYSLIGIDEQTALHLQIARHLFLKIAPEDIECVLFIITDQFGRGLSLISDREEKTRVAELHLRSAEKALSFFAHTSAAALSTNGILLLDEDHWKTDYRLALGLHTTSAEAHNIGGNFEQVESSANTEFARAQVFDHKLPMYLSYVQATGCRGLLLKATSIGLEVLQKLGVLLPANPDRNTAMMVIEQTKTMLESIPAEIASSQFVRDEKAVFAMKMLSLLSRYTFMSRKELMALIICRGVQLTVEHGVCNDGIVFIAHYAYLLTSTGNLAAGNKCKHLALSLIDRDRFKAKETLPLVYIQVYAQMIPIDPVQANFPQLEVAYRMAKEHGDMQVYCIAMNREVAVRFFYGDSLQSIETTARIHIQAMDNMQENLFSIFTKLFLQATVNLVDPSSNDPSTLTGEITDQTALLSLAKQMNNFALVVQIFRLRIYIAYLFRQYDLASELANDMLTTFTGSGASIQFLPNGCFVPGTFHIGLVSLHMARTKDAEKWLPVADDCMNRMKTWSEASQWNFGHMMRLMEAEKSYCRGDHVKAQAAYGDAIRLAGEHKFIHDQALCLERAALYYADTFGDASELCVRYMAEARELYAKWGALKKAATM